MTTSTLARPEVRRFPRREVTKVSAGIIEVYSFKTRLGWMAIASDGSLVSGLAFGHIDAPGAIQSVGRILAIAPEKMDLVKSAPTMIREVATRLRAFAEGEPVDFDDVSLDVAHLTPFGETVTQHCRQITWGETLSYAELAAECGRPGAARAVGNVMRNNRFPLMVPCHRVLASGGGLGGYSAPDGLAMKRRLLAMEQA